MDRQAILAEIARLEAQKAANPGMAKAFNDEITLLCDKLKRPAYSPRKVV